MRSPEADRLVADIEAAACAVSRLLDTFPELGVYTPLHPGFDRDAQGEAHYELSTALAALGRVQRIAQASAYLAHRQQAT